MKKYVIVIDNGLKSQEFDSENKEELLKKIDTGNYHILHIRGNDPVKITRENIVEIIEL